MAIAMRGLRVRPQCGDIVTNSDGLEHDKFTNRDAKLIR